MLKQPLASFKTTLVNWGFMCTLIGICAAALFALNTNLDLHTLTGGNVGEAAFRGIDISARIRMFYISIGLFLVSGAMSLYILNKAERFYSKTSIQIINQASLIIIGLTICSFFSSDLLLNLKPQPALNKIFVLLFPQAIIGAFVLFTLSTALLNKKYYNYTLGEYLPPFIGALAINLFLFYDLDISSPLTLMLLIVIQLVASLVLLQVSFIKPFILCAFIKPISNEIYLIANQHGINILTPILSTIIFSAILLAWITVSYFKTKNQTNTKHIYILALTSYLIIAHYTPFIQPQNEWMENANKALPLHDFFSYGKLPLIDSFNSHLLYDHFFSFIYCFINGFNTANGNSYELYDFFLQVLMILIVFYFLKRFFNDEVKAFLACALLPVLTGLLPPLFNLTLITILLVQITGEPPTKFKNYLISFWCIFLFVWRVDLALANLFAYTAICLINKDHVWSKIKALIIAGLSALTVFIIICMIKGTSPYLITYDIINHLAASQAYGYKALTTSYDSLFFIHYVVFPIAIVSIIIYLLILEQEQADSTSKFIKNALLFLSFFYLANIQRGLSRHGLVENTDLHVSTFAYFILSGFAYFLLRNKLNKNQNILIWLSVSCFLVFAFKPLTLSREQRSTFHCTALGIGVKNKIQVSSTYINRCLNFKSFADTTFQETNVFLNTILKPEQSFVDFSNSPMLYFYCNRKTPSYFDQFPNMLHTDHLQERFSKNISLVDFPVVIFSHTPENWYDHPDEVPNTIRHQKIAEWIFKNYHPLCILNKRSVWIRNHFKLDSALIASLKPDTFSTKAKHYNLLDYPAILAESFENVTYNKSITFHNELTLNDSITWLPIQNNFGKTLLITLPPDHKSGSLTVYYKQNDLIRGSFELNISATKTNYLIPLSTQYNWQNESINIIGFQKINFTCKHLNLSFYK